MFYDSILLFYLDGLLVYFYGN